MSHFRTQEAGSTTARAFTLIDKSSGSPITSGTVNLYIKNISGSNSGKWWRDSDQTWQVSETANGMTHQADGHWTRALAASPWSNGDVTLEYAKESGDLHVPVSRLLQVEFTPSADSSRGAAIGASALDNVATTLLDFTDGIESSLTVREGLRLVVAALAGKISGAATTTVTIRNYADDKNRITATVDAYGNRSSITTDLT